MMRRIPAIALTALLGMSVAACSTAGDMLGGSASTAATQDTVVAVEATTADETTTTTDDATPADETTATAADATRSVAVTGTVQADGSFLDTTDLFTDRDLEQVPDLASAVQVVLVSGRDVTLTDEGVYLLSGTATDVTVVVEADDEAKVQLVLDGVDVTNDDAPVIYVKSADKVFVTTISTPSSMEVTGEYTVDGDTNLDAVIFSKDDLVLNGTGALEIVSAEGNGVTSKDDLKVTGGTYSITSREDGLEANDSIRIAGGDITIVTDKDALHSENDDDPTLGYIYVAGGSLNLTAADDAIRGTSIVQIDGGTLTIETCTEGIEATQIQINGGDIDIYATDDGINASAKSRSFDVVIEVNGGTITVSMAGGDTDAFDSNGSIAINGGTIDITAPTSAFDAEGVAQLNGGAVTVNGQAMTQITQMGGPGGTQQGGGRPRK